MSSFAAGLFTRVQAAPFYAKFHREAAALLPNGNGRSWLDVGCGPGLLSRLAAEKSYRVTGADRDPAMQAAARRQSGPGSEAAVFLESDLAGLVAAGSQADVVSASSLLVVLPDPALGLRQLLSLLRPGGTLLIIEANERFGFLPALRHLRLHPQPSGGWWLLLWSLLRGGRTLAPAVLQPSPVAPKATPLLGGMVTAWTITSGSAGVAP